MKQPGQRAHVSVLGIGAVLTGLLGGVYYGFACAVMPGLARLDDKAYANAFNQINDVIQNPAFMLCFLGAPLVCIVALVMLRRGGGLDPWTITAAVLNVAALISTMAISVPLNDALEKNGDRAAFEHTWLVWNDIRTLFCAAALACLLRALWIHARRLAPAPA